MPEKRKEKNMLKPKQILPVVVALFIIAGITFAQPPPIEQKAAERECVHGRIMPEHRWMMPDLSEAQLGQMRTLRTEHMKALQPLQNQLGEKKARLRTLTTADKVSMTEINKVIDDIGNMHTQIMKLNEQHRQEIRKILNDEQRLFFDSHEPPQHGAPHQGIHQEKEMP